MARPATPRRAAVLLGAVTLAVAMTAVLVPAAGAAAPSCRVKNPTQDTWFATRDGRALTRAIAAANPGDRLNVFGTCRGNYVVDRDLRVFGNPQATAPTTLDGRGSGRVLTVLPSLLSSVTVTLTRLVVTGGGEGGIEVGEGTTVALTSSTVRGNTATNRVGAGIANGERVTVVEAEEIVEAGDHVVALERHSGRGARGRRGDRLLLKLALRSRGEFVRFRRGAESRW